MINKPKNGKKRKANTNIDASKPKLVKLDSSNATEDTKKTKNKNNKQTVTPKLPNNSNNKPQKQNNSKAKLNGTKSSDNENKAPIADKKKNKRKKKPVQTKNDDSSDEEGDVNVKQILTKTNTDDSNTSNDEADTKTELPKKNKNKQKKTLSKDSNNLLQSQNKKQSSKVTLQTTELSNDDSDEEMPSIITDTKGDDSGDESDSEQTDDESKATTENKIDVDALSEKFPILKDQKLIESFLNVPLSNNQKGRIRQALVQKYKDVPAHQKPDIINSRIQVMLTGTVVDDSQLRRIRILYNMLKESLKNIGQDTPKINLKREKPKKTIAGQKGPKRYVVFVGNLPLGTQKERLMHHFMDLTDHIKDVRIPVAPEGKKRSIAYIEMDNEASYELALSKNHTMLDNRRIKVEYCVQKNSKISKTDAKGKSAKLAALQKSGKLLGSVPLEKKRSQRRKKMKSLRAAAEAE